MANILALESSSSLCSVALQANGRLQCLQDSGQRSHTRLMLPFVEQLLADADVSLAELDAIAFSAGPGPFTGIRLGASVAKSLGYASDKPVVAVSSLAAIAQAYRRQTGFTGQCLVVTDARMDELYVAEFSFNAEGGMNIVQADQLLSLNAFAALSHGASVVLGDAEALIKALPNMVGMLYQHLLASAEDVLQLAEALLAEGRATDALTAQAVYLRGKSGWKNIEQQQAAG